ncbi:MAG: thiamine phosphate synthase [Prevotella sp.]|nr:thiamine phosphate synthase [Prevotella sp.]
MKLVIMTQPTFFVEEDKILTALFDEGMDDLHICKPGASPMYTERLLSLLPESLCRKIVVHNHFYLKNEFNLAGIHIDDPTQPLPGNYKGKYGVTCSDLNQLAEMKKKADYVFLHCTFDNPTEENSQVITLKQIEDASIDGILDKRVYAFGDINLDNVRLAKDFGFGGVVICNDLWSKFDIQTELDYKDLIAHFYKFLKAVS